MDNINILDCTLRDGGIVNQFEFMEDIPTVIGGLSKSGIEIVECGYVNSNCTSICGKTELGNIKDFERYIPSERFKTKYSVMMNYGYVDINSVCDKDDGQIEIIRVAFHKKDLDGAVLFCEQLQQKGYIVCLNVMESSTYSEEEWKGVVDIVNDKLPFLLILSVADSYGCMLPQNVLTMMGRLDMNLNRNINIGFHSHNNMQLAFANVLNFGDIPMQHKKVIDATLSGMGKGAGNLPTELISSFLNEKYSKSYSVKGIFQLVDLIENKYRPKSKWGYSTKYLITAMLQATSMYATYFDSHYDLNTNDFMDLMSYIEKDSLYHFHELKAQRALKKNKNSKPRREIEGWV